MATTALEKSERSSNTTKIETQMVGKSTYACKSQKEVLTQQRLKRMTPDGLSRIRIVRKKF